VKEAMIDSIEIGSITPLHEARSRRHLQSLTDTMKENGWRGRPLLVIERRSDYLAWTGSHRLAAAKLAGLRSVPCYVLREAELTSRGFDAEHGHVEDYERLKILREIGDETAISIMWQENRA
jgi:ParB-like chromosome segregation protein Spo0J